MSSWAVPDPGHRRCRSPGGASRFRGPGGRHREVVEDRDLRRENRGAVRRVRGGGNEEGTWNHGGREIVDHDVVLSHD